MTETKIPDFFSDQSLLDEAVNEARAAFAADRASGREYDTTTAALHRALNNAEFAAVQPTHDFAKFATQALGGGWWVMGKHNRKVDVWAPSGATCEYDVDATKEAVLAAAQKLSKSYWSRPDTSIGSTGQSWWDE